VVVNAVGVDTPVVGDHWKLVNFTAVPQVPLIVAQVPAHKVMEGVIQRPGFGTTVTVATT
jgi:hypothetical protein